ncbi:MAG TPA: Ig-like domain-containing protein, partial [Chitinophagaceae bacterium]|nr:Ig-like domain-containing protein [Chitinophagaceae bacterium]
MKTILLFIATTFTLITAKAQYTQNFEGTENSLTDDCWTLNDVHKTSAAEDVITGTGSMYTNPPTNGSGTRDIITPALNITSTSFSVSFNYKLSSTINGNATRTIEVGLLDPSANFTSLTIITMDKNSPTTVQNFNQTFTLASIGARKLVIKLGGSTGDGNTRLIFDDMYADAGPLYNIGTGACNSAPIAVNDVYNGISGFPLYENVMSNDSDPNGETMSPAVVTISNDGVVVMNQDGSFSFTPNPGFAGPTATFTYQLADNGFAPDTSNIALVTINYSSPIILPVKLVSFSAMLNADKVDLKWITSSEKNVSHFSIEKSTDGVNYSEAGLIFANGNTSETMNYSFTDANINISQAGVIYYRLRSVDIDGKSELSQVKTIRIGKKNEQFVSILTYPNPVSAELRITIPANWQGKKVNYELFNNNGQVLIKNMAVAGSQTETLNVNSLAPGFYIVKVTCNGEIAQQKIIK